MQVEPLDEIIENIPVPSVIVDSDAHIIYANKMFPGIIGDGKLTGMNELFGNVVSCNETANETGLCGRNAACKNCLIRNSIDRTIKTGEPVIKLEGSYKINAAGKQKELILQVSTSRIVYDGKPCALLFIEDLTSERKSLQALKDERDRYFALSLELEMRLEEKISKEISKLKETEKVLQESKSLYELISDYSNDWEVFRAKDKKLVYCSLGIERLLGYTVDEYKNNVKYTDIVHPEDYSTAVAELMKLFSGERVPPHTFRMIKKNKDIIWVEVFGQPVFSETGELLGTRTSTRDITQLKESEEKFSAAFNKSPEQVVANSRNKIETI